jgi:hypothetical protein
MTRTRARACAVPKAEAAARLIRIPRAPGSALAVSL